jgi:phospholipase C
MPLTVRDAAARNLAEVLDFESRPNLHAPRYDVPRPVSGGCLTAATAPSPEGARPHSDDHVHHGEDWYGLADYVRHHRFGR